MTLTCQLGKFFFPEGTSLVDAKAIRDTVMGAWYSSREKATKFHMRTVEDCKKVTSSVNWENRAAKLPYQLELNPR